MNATQQEFNLLADLICAAPSKDDNFKLNLFPDQFAFSQGVKGSKDDDTTINIDLGKQVKDQRIENLK